MTAPHDPIRPKERVYQAIVENLQAQILAGDLKPGDRIPAERDLATHFGVSRAAVREAMKALAEKGLVDVHVGRGSFVAVLTTDHVVEAMSLLLRDARNTPEHLQEAREIVEVPIARLAAVQRSAEHLARLQHLLREIEAHRHMSRFIDTDSEFHHELARATGNPVLEIVIRTLLSMLRSERVFMVGFRDEIPGANGSHASIVMALERRDADAAGAAMSEHLRHVSAVLRSLRGPAPIEQDTPLRD